jgi:hypothetical protein
MTSSRRLSNLALSGLALAAVPALVAAACSATGNPSTFDSGGSGGGGTTTTSSQGGSHSGGGDNTGGSIMIDAGSGTGGGGGATPTVDPKTCQEAETYKTYIGCDFYPTVVANNVWSTFDFAVVVANAGDQAADVTVTRNGQMAGSAQVQPNSLATIYLPWVPELKGPDADECGSSTPLAQTVRANGGAYYLHSTVPVTVYQFNALEYKGQGGPPNKSWSSCPGNKVCADQGGAIGCFSFSNDASLLLPATAMTGNYRITGQAGWPFNNPDPTGPQGIGPYFAITATQDDTSVTVYASKSGNIIAGGGISAVPANGMTTFTLNKGDVAELVGDYDADLSGSLVKASAPVQVISGMPCRNQPLEVGACDHIEESVFPAETLGKHYFVATPTGPGGNLPGHIVRIFGNVDGTKLSYPSGNAPPGAPSTINAGDVVDLGIVTADFEIKGDHEFAVGSFMLGAQLLDPLFQQGGDPSMSLSTTVEQYRTKYVFLAPSDYDVSWVDIVQPVGTMVTLDGQPVNPTSKKAIGSSSYEVARVLLGAGNGGAHVLTSSAAVGIQIIGYGQFTSYQYPGGLNLGIIAPPPPPPG